MTTWDEMQEIQNELGELTAKVRKIKLDLDVDRLLKLIEIQNRELDELREHRQRSIDRSNRLRERLMDWGWLEGMEDDFDPTCVYDFLIDIGISPFALPSSLGERMEMRDRLQKAY